LQFRRWRQPPVNPLEEKQPLRLAVIGDPDFAARQIGYWLSPVVSGRHNVEVDHLAAIAGLSRRPKACEQENNSGERKCLRMLRGVTADGKFRTAHHITP
jgi:hypothetical protein